jgi:hypothetical protein
MLQWQRCRAIQGLPAAPLRAPSRRPAWNRLVPIARSPAAPTAWNHPAAAPRVCLWELARVGRGTARTGGRRVDGSRIESQQVNVVGVRWTFRMLGPTCQDVLTVDF